ncbi:MAG: hypothetical protein RI953_2509 [Pseudomonadota bacterium]|jgi:acetyltransferase-like isoleucine patch superfamily enzyme
MELTEKQVSRKIHQVKTFLHLVGRAIRSHFLLVPSMARNFLMFWLSNLVMRISPLHRRGLLLGRNVRIQRLRSLVRIGSHSRIEIGDDSILYEHARLEVLGHGCIRIGQCGVIGDCRISARELVVIGNRVLTSWNVFIQDNDPHPLDPSLRGEQVKSICRKFYPKFGAVRDFSEQENETRWIAPTDPVLIGDDVWLGANCTILKGARVGDGCIVASGSVVTGGEYPPRSIIAGNPARVIRRLVEREVLA